MTCYIPKRYILAGLAHFGFFVCYALRVNLSVAIVSMVNHTYANEEKIAVHECQKENDTKVSSEVRIGNAADVFELNWYVAVKAIFTLTCFSNLFSLKSSYS